MEQLAQEPHIFSIPGDETGTVGFGKKWIRAVEELANAEQLGGGGTDGGPR
ncbi:hypothetical protein [Streptomyces sp. NPDC015414]|uniref:hypothetical protein n=1 Tax=Streptomyces sp. NPDC015414 TaxID=3364957 RepID=UPI0036FAEFA6